MGKRTKMGLHFSEGDRNRYTAANTTGGRYVQLDAVNLEGRLNAAFEYLNYFVPVAVDISSSTVKEAWREKHRNLFLSAVKDALEAARGGLFDARNLVLDALFFAWVKDMPVVVPCDPFLACRKWRISTHLFAWLVKELGLEANLKHKLHSIPELAYRHLALELGKNDGSSQLFVHEGEGGDVHLKTNKLGNHSSALTAPVYGTRGVALSTCKQCINKWEQLRGSPVTAFDVSHAMNHFQQAVRDCEQSGRLTGSLLLCSSRFHASRRAVRVEESRQATVECNLIAVLNKVTVDPWPQNKQGRAKYSAADAKDTLLTVKLLDPLLVAPKITLSRYVLTAAKYSTQAPYLLSVLAAQPGLAGLQLDPTQPPLLMIVLAQILLNPPSELRRYHQLLGIMKFAVALFQRKDGLKRRELALEAKGTRHENQIDFGQPLAFARRSHLDPREGLLTTVLPSLSSGFHWQSGDNQKDGGGLNGSKGGEFRALEILYSLLTEEDPTGTLGHPLSPSGLNLLKATFPGGLLLALAQYIDHWDVDRTKSAFSRSPSNDDMLRAAPERINDLATSLLRSCVQALREDRLVVDRRRSATDSLESSVLLSLAAADAAAATRLTWHARLMLEPALREVRKRHPTRIRAPSSVSTLFDRSYISRESRVAFAFADLIRLCSTSAVHTAEVVNQLQGGETREAERSVEYLNTKYIVDLIDAVRSTDSSDLLRSALLTACVWTLPKCTMKEFHAVLRDFLPKILLFIRGTRAKDFKVQHQGQVPHDDAEIIAQQLVMNFLTRVLLTTVSGLEAHALIAKSRRAIETVQTLSRQLATAVNTNIIELDRETSSVQGATLALQNLKCLATTLLRIEKLPEGLYNGSEDVLLSAVLQQVGGLHWSCMRREVMKLFSRFLGTSRVKHQVTCLVERLVEDG